MTQEILVEDLMTPDVICARADTEAANVTRMMRTHCCSCLIVAEKGYPIGVITERDIVSVLTNVFDGRSSRDWRARDFMSAPPVSVKKSTTLFEALVFAKARKIRHLPVVGADGKLVGIVTQTDLTHAHHHIFELQRELIEDNEQLKALSFEDALLEIGNRRAMEVDLQHTHEWSRRYQRNYSIALLDVDCFKLYNDHYGHIAGDRALRQITDYLRQTIRSSDRLYRYGGEELLVLLPEIELVSAAKLCNRLIEGIARCDIPHCKSPFTVVTVSGGVGFEGGRESPDSGWQETVRRADEALYLAKHNGRNQVAV